MFKKVFTGEECDGLKKPHLFVKQSATTSYLAMERLCTREELERYTKIDALSIL